MKIVAIASQSTFVLTIGSPIVASVVVHRCLLPCE
jgi:hypothetical protein